MNWLDKLKQNSISSLLLFLLVLIISNGILDYTNRVILQKHELVVKDVKQVQLTLQKILQKLNACDLGFRGFYILPTEKMLEPYTLSNKYLKQPFDEIRTILARQGVDSTELDPVERAMRRYFDLTAEMVIWRQQENYDSIRSVVAKDLGGEVWHVYSRHSKAVEAQQEKILAESQDKTQNSMLISSVLRIVLFVLGIPTLLIVLWRLRHERRRRAQLFKALDEQNKTRIFNSNLADNNLDESRIIKSLITNLDRAAEFIANIGKGKLDVDWEGLTPENKVYNKNNLAGELIQMRDQMVKIKKSDEQRLWFTEGLSKISEIVRLHQNNAQALADKITSTVTQYMGANQASLFFSEKNAQQEIILKLQACYAFDRKKFIDKIIEPGQGIVGQVYLEKEMSYITNAPKDYVKITSGLGQATPTTLIIVPLKVNERVEGILELASFKKYEPFELEFLKSAADIIGSAILIMRTNAEMRLLMEDLQSQSEELKAQEEEMRQNMEELEATQEEMQRKTKEYETILQKLDIPLEKKKQVLLPNGSL